VAATDGDQYKNRHAGAGFRRDHGSGHDREHGGPERFEIELGRGRIVRVGPSFDAEALRRLVQLLEEDGSC
jgi:hypothetical protein